ncbi:hypothetical protein [Spongiactinospora gelatinilytica]|nr:hypothetical protein [Spongiactinospora gelatinilytica]
MSDPDIRRRLWLFRAEPTPYDHLAEQVIDTPIGGAVPRLCETLLAGG